MEWDIFISHASEDKVVLVSALAEKLRDKGLSVWYDDFILQPGDSLRQSIDQGLSESRCGVVILSEHFFGKKWPQAELDGLVALARSLSSKRIIPIWHGVSHADVAEYSPTIADLFALDSSIGLSKLAEKILHVIQREYNYDPAPDHDLYSQKGFFNKKTRKDPIRLSELKEICSIAVEIGEDALLGNPSEDFRDRYSREYAPFSSENIDQWREAAHLDIIDGQFLLGTNLADNGAEDEGILWLEKAASEGHLIAKRYLGDKLLDIRKSKRGLQLLLSAANSGDANSCYLLALRYSEGDGVPKSKKKAFKFTSMAATLGNHYAKTALKTYELCGEI